MHEHHLFEYAIIRVMPRVERGEFLNVGVILYCPRQKFLGMLFTIDEKRLSLFADTIDVQELYIHLDVFTKIAEGGKEAGPIGRLDIASRFRWLTATRSTIVQSSKVHTGFAPDPRSELEKLHRLLVAE